MPAPDSTASFWPMALGSLGVVYGDIGTSPLYALKASLDHAKVRGVSAEEVIGIVSLLTWALIFTVTAKYVLFLMRADNRGEGGIVALLALLSARNAAPGTWRAQLLVVAEELRLLELADQIAQADHGGQGLGVAEAMGQVHIALGQRMLAERGGGPQVQHQIEGVFVFGRRTTKLDRAHRLARGHASAV